MHRLLSSKQRRKWFNLDVIRTTSKTEAVLQDIMQEFSLYQMVSKQSHSSNILDLLFTNDDTTISGVDVVDNLPMCDHDALVYSINLSKQLSSSSQRRQF